MTKDTVMGGQEEDLDESMHNTSCDTETWDKLGDAW